MHSMLAYRFTHFLDIMLILLFFEINTKYRLLYCILQYAHAETWLI